MKDWMDLLYVMDFVSIGILITAISINSLSQIEAWIKAYMINSWLLSLLIFFVAVKNPEHHLYVASTLTFASKRRVTAIFLKEYSPPDEESASSRNIFKYFLIPDYFRNHNRNCLRLTGQGYLCYGFFQLCPQDICCSNIDWLIYNDNPKKCYSADPGAFIYGKWSFSGRFLADLWDAFNRRAWGGLRPAYDCDNNGCLYGTD